MALCRIKKHFRKFKNQKKMREKIGFWILGLCNNFGYVIMLSSAMDILNPSHFDGEKFKRIVTDVNNASIKIDPNPRDCNPISTGAVLLADIIPTVIIKLLSPFVSVGIHFRIASTVILNVISFILVALAHSSEWTFTGIVCASLSSGLGEVSFLSSMSYLQQDVVSFWSSGTGAAGIAGATAYATMTGMGMSPRTTLLSMLIVPLIMVITFWAVVSPKLNQSRPSVSTGGYESLGLFDIPNETDENSESNEEENEDVLRFHLPRGHNAHEAMSFNTRLALIPGLLKYMAPIGVVYFFEYLINQGLFELLYFPKFTSVMNHHEQYRWYQVIYQVGVFVSRSSLICLSFRRIWILSVLQFLNFIVLLPQAIFWFMPSYWIVFGIVLWEGLLGGCSYVNTYANIRRSIQNPSQQEFALGFTCLADSLGIAISGLLALPLHKAICNMPVISLPIPST